MQFVYATDLHGNQEKYEKILSFAIEKKIKLIHLGADLLPKTYQILKEQKYFIKTFMKSYYNKAAEKGVQVLAFFGNDDVYTRKKYFKSFGVLLDENPFTIDGFMFKAYPYVCDYPFGLKTACKLDYAGWKRPVCCNPVDVTENGIEHIQDLNLWFSKRTTIEDDLKKEKNIYSSLIMSFHMPPSDLNLDVCGSKKRVGSKSILKWIKKEQPLLCLHGHIHESYEVTNVWKCKVGKTLVVQPGQMCSKTNIVLFDIESESVNATLIQL